MNILFLTEEYYHEKLPDCGGTGRFLSNLSKLLIMQNHKVFVFSLAKNNITIDDFGVKIVYKKNKLYRNHIYKLSKSLCKKIPFLKKYYSNLLKLELKLTVKELNKFILKNNLQIDIIETHDFDGISLYVNNKIPYVIRCHGCFSIFSKYFNVAARQHILDWEKEAFNKAKNIITISKYSQNLYHELFNLKDTKLIYNSIDNEKFKKIASTSVIPKSVFYLGNISTEKGADIAIQVFIDLIKIEPESTLHFIGRETTYKKELLKIITENNIMNNVFFYGFLQIDEIVALISKAEVVIFPSMGETFGFALCETMSIGKPIVASNIGSFNEIITNKQNGIIANSNQEYLDAILYYFEDKDRANIIAENARKTIVENFSEAKLLNETTEYYKEIIANHQKESSP